MLTCFRSMAAILAVGAVFAASPALADLQVRRVSGGVTTIALDDAHLARLGLVTAHTRDTAALDDAERHLSGTAHSFIAENGPGASLRVKDGGFAGFVGGEPFAMKHAGGFALAANGTNDAARPVFVYDFEIEIDPARGSDGIRLLAGHDASPFDVRGANFVMDAAGDLRIILADLLVSESLARAIGRPELVGDWAGTIDVRLRTDFVRKDEVFPEDKPTDAPPWVDVKLGELYGLDDVGRIGGTFPAGTLGLSAATTSCNVGTADVPWLEPMNENHPTIGLTVYRLLNDRLEMIGRNWSKHGFFALSSSQCTPCQHFSNGTFLGVGCSDTYSVGNNASQYYLGRREEVNPFTGAWTCLGSYFDATPVDCERDFFGGGLNSVAHRIEVPEAELLLGVGAAYYYEGCYYVRDDLVPTNNVGWRQVNVSHPGGNTWTFATVGTQLAPNLGPVVLTWGDVQDTEIVASDDGEVILSTKVTDLGGGQWHYEYALYNRSSHRGIREFSIPIGEVAVVSATGFHDIDQNATNDWGSTIADGYLTWSTGLEGESGANPITYQSLYNFRFDSDTAPVASQARGGISKPGVGTDCYLETQSPFASTATGVETAAHTASELELRTDPNPFAESTRISFTLPTKGTARLTVTDVSGRTLRTLFEGEAAAGRRDVTWDGRDDAGHVVSSGVYFFRVESEGRVRTIKGTLLK